MAYKSIERRRRCGWRGVGGIYAVSSGGTVGGTVHTDCNFVALHEVIPAPKDAPDPGRGFVYVNGEAILDGGQEWGITPTMAEALKLMWELWGMGRERFDTGIGKSCYGSQQITGVLQMLQWAEGSVETWPDATWDLQMTVENLRKRFGDCPLVPAIMEVRRLHWIGPIANRPDDTLAALWRLVTELSWIEQVPETVLDTVASIMEDLGAAADAPLLTKFYVETEEEQ